MKLQVVSYHSGIPVVNKSPEKSNILYYMIEGVNACGDIGRNHFELNTLECDVAVLQGFVHEHSPAILQHHILKYSIQSDYFRM